MRDSADLAGLARSPLLLTAMTIAYLDSGRLPDSRADLLRGAVEWQISQKQRLLRGYVRSGRDVRVIFSELAFQMMAKEETPQSRVGIGWAADCLRSLDCYRGEVREFLETAVSAGCLLMRRGPGDIGMHEAFRDYLAASRIAAKTDDPAEGWWSELAPHLDDPEWHSVVALVPGELLLLGGSERVDLFFDLLGASCAGQDLASGRVGLRSAGASCSSLGWSGYRLSGAPRWAEAVRSMRELMDDPGDVPLDVRYAAAAAYGVMGDERLADPDGSWIPVPGGPILDGSPGTGASGAELRCGRRPMGVTGDAEGGRPVCHQAVPGNGGRVPGVRRRRRLPAQAGPGTGPRRAGAGGSRPTRRGRSTGICSCRCRTLRSPGSPGTSAPPTATGLTEQGG